MAVNNAHQFLSLIITVIIMIFSSCSDNSSTNNNAMSTKKSSIDTMGNHMDSSYLSMQYLLGKFNPSAHEDFDTIPIKYADRKDLLLRKDALKAYIKMYKAAVNDGHQLTIRSATRNFDYQKGIWERKWNARRSDFDSDYACARDILLYSSMPGTSRHHWGTDIDINSFDNAYFKTGNGKELYAWMKEHAASYGFCQPYTEKTDGRTGYEEECWHWSYIPIASALTQFAYKNHNDSLITGFIGSETADSLDVVEKYVLGIACQSIKGHNIIR